MRRRGLTRGTPEAFGAFDWGVLFVYLAASLAIGLRAARGGRDFKDYVLGGGAMPWIPVGISIIATSVSATTFLGAPADVFGADMTFLMFQFGGLLSIIVVGWAFIPRFRAAGVGSAYELLERRFSRSVRRVAAVFYSLHLLLRTGILLYGPALVLAGILQVPLTLAILITALVAIVYTWHGGFRAVVWTDVMQFGVFFLGGLVVMGLVARAVGGPDALAEMAGAAGKTRWFNPSLDPTDARTLVSAGLAYGILELAIRGCDQQFVQRYLSCRSPAEANRSSVLSMVLGVAVSLLFYWVGAALFVYYRVANSARLPEDAGVNDVFPWFILHDLPVGLRGLIVAAIYAAAMSSLSSAINALASTTENDLLCSRADDPRRLRRARIWSLAWGVLGVGGAFFAMTQHGSLLKNALFFTGLFTGPLLGLFVFAFWRPRTRPTALHCGMAGGIVTLLAFSHPPFSWGWQPLYPFSWPWNPALALAGMALVTVVADWALRLASRRRVA